MVMNASLQCLQVHHQRSQLALEQEVDATLIILILVSVNVIFIFIIFFGLDNYWFRQCSYIYIFFMSQSSIHIHSKAQLLPL